MRRMLIPQEIDTQIKKIISHVQVVLSLKSCLIFWGPSSTCWQCELARSFLVLCRTVHVLFHFDATHVLYIETMTNLSSSVICHRSAKSEIIDPLHFKRIINQFVTYFSTFMNSDRLSHKVIYTYKCTHAHKSARTYVISVNTCFGGALVIV